MPKKYGLSNNFQRENKRMANTHIHTLSFSYKILYVSLLITDYLIGLAYWAIPIGL